ncbi:MAG: HAD-IA family hydrolase [Erysipelotrichaceae bacterium]|nr:HAD-IA family hydrolase [Erysipelotrichaceae bacterium]
MSRYTAALFDLDGTLTASAEGIIKSFRYAFEKMNLPLDETRDLSVVIGPPLKGSFAAFGVPEERLDEAVTAYRERYNTIGKYENEPFEGIRELLGRLKEAGVKLYVATSKPEAMALDILNHFDLVKYFDEIAGATLGDSRSSKKDVILYLLNKTEIKGNTVMVGDTAFDIIGAREAGIEAIGVSWGYGTIESMREAEPLAIVNTMDELYEMIVNTKKAESR